MSEQGWRVFLGEDEIFAPKDFRIVSGAVVLRVAPDKGVPVTIVPPPEQRLRQRFKPMIRSQRP